MTWKAKVDSTVANREELEFATLLGQFQLPADVDAQAVRRALAVIEQEYSVPIGKLRADDKLTLFLTGVTPHL